MGSVKVGPRARLFPVSEKMFRVLRADLQVVLLDPKKLKRYLVLKSEHLAIINHPLCATWLVTWNGDGPSSVWLQFFGRYFQLNCQTIVKGPINLDFDKEACRFPLSANVFDETWGEIRKVGAVILTPEQCRKRAEHMVLIFMNIPTPSKLLHHWFRRLLQKFWHE